MSLDTVLLGEAKAAEARLIEAQHATEVAQADFHRAVRRLHIAGASLREVATALDLSHQRVHQIVEAAGGSRRWRRGRAKDGSGPGPCSFCGRVAREVKTLIAGPGVYICNRCVTLADQTLATGQRAVTPTAVFTAVAAEAVTERCSFCGKRRHQVPGLAAASGARICAECLGLCHEIITERLA